ncbi:uncharacterized protein LOC114298336 [Camellia sinensis]|uniref:uncharacterized protein LOC114298336 n=1 Tax=Camellia sinensis TaxID=4442 RepID=UPI00103563B5|nr:uncharacterized protein LOC114298336 [Camellia sinensis]
MLLSRRAFGILISAKRFPFQDTTRRLRKRSMDFARPPGERIKKAFSERYPGNIIGVGPRILFSYKYLEAECKNAAFQKSLRNLDFCKEIPIPGYYKETEKKKYGLRKATTYKGKPHPSHVMIDKRKYLQRTKSCKCYLCGEEGHYARDCDKEKKNVKRVALFENIEVPEDYEVVSVHPEEEDSDVCR